MKLNKKLDSAVALLCIVQMCLLLLASVSPQIHTWVFHSGEFNAGTCSEAHSNCGTLPDNPEEHGPQPNLPDNKDGFCPVVLFEAGIDFTDGTAILLSGRCAFIASIEAEPDTVWTSAVKGRVQVRAPPAG